MHETYGILSLTIPERLFLKKILLHRAVANLFIF